MDILRNIFILGTFWSNCSLETWFLKSFFSQHTERQGFVSRDGTTAWHLCSDRDLEQLHIFESVEAEWEFPLQCHCSNLDTHSPPCKSAVNWSPGLSLSASAELNRAVNYITEHLSFGAGNSPCSQNTYWIVCCLLFLGDFSPRGDLPQHENEQR